MKHEVIAIVNQKGGVGKTTTCVNLGIGMAKLGYKVLIIDMDPQASLTISLGNTYPDKISFTLNNAMSEVINEEHSDPKLGILEHNEGVSYMPANMDLSSMELSLVNVMGRETVLRQYLDTVKDGYDYVLIDCPPFLGMLTINALAATDRVLIPVQPEYLAAKGLEELLDTILKVRRRINPRLRIAGVLITMLNAQTNFAKETVSTMRSVYGNHLRIFCTAIPYSVRAKECSALGKSIFAHDPNGKVALAYKHLTHEVLADDEK